MAINFPEVTKRKMAEKFSVEAETGSMFSHEYDQEFSGAKTVNVNVVTTTPMQDYNRSKQVGTGSRYGDTVEVGDTVLTYTMTRDRSLSLSIDKGNKKDQFNMKSAENVMRAEKQEHIIPELDKYRLKKWAEGAGIHIKVAKPSKANFVETLMDAHTVQQNAHVGKSVTCVIPRSNAKFLVLSDDFERQKLPDGSIGNLDGMTVKPINDDLMPAGVEFMLIYKGSIISPVKIQELKVHIDPPGLSGDLLEYRMYYDAFVLGHLADGVVVGVSTDSIVATPTISMSGKTATITAADGATVKYTLDGSDPRYSNTAKTGKTATVNTGDTLRVAAIKDGQYWSNVAKN